jgi:hypothetical protein
VSSTEVPGTPTDSFGLVGFRQSGNTQTTLAVGYSAVVTNSPQTVTVSARAVNGVSRAWPAGTEVDVWFPAIVGL